MSFSVSADSVFWTQFKYSLSGEVVQGLEIVKLVEGYGSQSGAPKKVIKIAESGTI